jgi:hypothetical protein
MQLTAREMASNYSNYLELTEVDTAVVVDPQFTLRQIINVEFWLTHTAPVNYFFLEI